VVRVWSMTLRLILTWSDGGTSRVTQPMGTYHTWLWLIEVGGPWTPLDCWNLRDAEKGSNRKA
jgi:hypothetical protein